MSNFKQLARQILADLDAADEHKPFSLPRPWIVSQRQPTATPAQSASMLFACLNAAGCVECNSQGLLWLRPYGGPGIQMSAHDVQVLAFEEFGYSISVEEAEITLALARRRAGIKESLRGLGDRIKALAE